MNSTTKNLSLGVAIVAVGGFAAYRLMTSSAGPDFPRDYTIQGVCIGCKAETPLTQRIRERPPFECGACKKKAVFPWYYCPDCKKRYVPAPSKAADGTLRVPIVPTCPECGGAKGTNFDPADTEQRPTGDLKLPALP